MIPDNRASARCLIKNGFEWLLTKPEDWGYGEKCIADVYTRDLWNYIIRRDLA